MPETLKVRIAVAVNENRYDPGYDILVDGRNRISVCTHDHLIDGTWYEPEINWSCVGAVSIEKAGLMRDAMTLALDVAKILRVTCVPGTEATEESRLAGKQISVPVIPGTVEKAGGDNA